MTSFIYCLTNEKSEKFLKEEMRLKYPKATFAFSRPQFLTFKWPYNFAPQKLIFARHFGISLKDKHQYERTVSFHRTGDTIGEEVALGEKVLDVITIDEGKIFYGEYTRTLEHPPVVNANFNFILPEEAPSRAYLKVLEALKWTGVEIQKGETVLEVGSSPGGASYALLQMGARVIGLDPGEMDPICLKHPNFVRLKKPVQQWQKIQEKVDWCFVDMNLAPLASLNEMKKVVQDLHPHLQGAFFTLKLTKLSVLKQLKQYETLIYSMGFKRIPLMKQMPSHHQEFLLFAKN